MTLQVTGVTATDGDECLQALPTRDRQLSLLSGFELRDQGRVVSVAPASQRFLAVLGLHERPLLRSYVGGTLWPDTAEARASSCLRTAMWRTPSPGGVPIFTATTSHIVLDPQVRVDYREVVSWATDLVGPSVELTDRPRWSGAGDLDDELLPGWYDEWILVERESFRQLRLHALERLCERLAAEGRFAEALRAGLAAVASEPLRESAHRRVIAVHLQEGNIAEALRQYRRCAGILADELRLRPSPAMQSMVEPWLYGDEAVTPVY
jgi:DNA-binding SARP family transcriptional activator